jgi:hypothetical protein
VAYLAIAGRAAMIVVFAVSAAGKLRGRRRFLAFAGSLSSFLPARLTTAAAGALCLAEAATAVLLALPTAAGYGCLLAITLLSVFTLATGWAVVTGRQARCRCFGARERPIGPGQVIRNAALLTAAVCGLGTGPVAVPGAVVAVAAGAIGAVIAMNAAELFELLRPLGPGRP